MPAESWHAIERIALTGGVMIKNVFTGQFRSHEGVTPVPAASSSPHLGFMSAYPLQLRPERLAAEVLARIGQDRLIAVAAGDQVDFLSRPGIDAVQDGWAEWLKISIAEHQARPHAADADRNDGPGSSPGQDLADCPYIPPPRALGIGFSPARPRQ